MCEYERSVFLASLAPCGTEGAIAVARARTERERDTLLSELSPLQKNREKARACARARTKPKNRAVKSKTHHFLRGRSRRRAQRHRRRDDRRDRFPRDGGGDDGLIIFIAFEGGFGKSSVLWVSSPIIFGTRSSSDEKVVSRRRYGAR